MQFKKFFAVASLAASALAAPATVPVNETKAIDFSELAMIDTFDFVADPNAATADLQDRAIITSVVTTVILSIAKDILTPYVKMGIEKAGVLIKELRNWTNAREQFTKATVLSLWQSNPDPRRYPAVICYNMDYRLSNPSGIAGWAKAELKMSILKTDYDCFYMMAPNTFHGLGDGGFINFASLNDKSRCTFSSRDRQIRCL
ncbi:hypothetical protein RB595_010639 [Gaeumannomyces hyphopodioides]